MAGVRGKSGRHGAKQELMNYRELIALFQGKYNLGKIEKRIASGKYSVRDRFIFDLLKLEKPEARIALFRKLFPDSILADIQSRTEFDAIRLDK